MEETQTPVNLQTLPPAQRSIVKAERRAAVARLLNRGRSLRETAEELGLSFGQVATVHKAIIREAEKAFLADAKRHRARLLYRNHVLQRKAWDALERFERGKVKKEALATADGESTPAKVTVESDHTAEARVIETLRKLQADEAKILGFVIPEPDRTPQVNIERGLIIVNEAGLPGTIPWLDTIPRGPARQGLGALPEGTSDAEIERLQKEKLDSMKVVE